jgi:Flp pilus assembly protein TadG
MCIDLAARDPEGEISAVEVHRVECMNAGREPRMARWRRVRGRTRDRGAAAVEFALVVPVLLLLVMGILDYGRFFFDSVSLRQGAREAARQAVVQVYAASCTTGTVGDKIACSAKAASDVTIGTPVVRIPTLASDWAQGKQVLVCMQSKEQGTGFVPLPANGILRTKTYMSIEEGTLVGDPSYTTDSAPAGSDWTWCS